MDRKVWRNFDFVLLGATVLLIAFGVAMIHSATLGTPNLRNLAPKQALYALLGLALMLLAAAIDYRLLASFDKFLYALGVVPLVAVLAIGRTMHGAQRWISLRFFPFQPSELAKVLLIVTLAKLLADHPIGRFRFVLLSLAHVALPMVLIYLQPDLGMAVILGLMWLAMALMAGMRLPHLGLLAAAGTLSAPLIWNLLEDYMRRRLILFLNPALEPEARYNLDQALISIGSGGWLGKGYGSGSQSQLHFLRVRHTDFIFSVIGEEMGLLGALLLFALLLVILLRIIRAASLARDAFGRLIACGVAAAIFLQSVVNIGMNLGLLPVTGIPLPFVSYGGSSLVTFLLAEGLVQSVIMRHKKIEF